MRDGGCKLPPGFRFEPTDEEIVFQYLSRKTFSHPLPALLIPEFDVFGFDPWELPGKGDREKDMYFFCNKEGGRKMGRATDSGFWRETGSSKRIICSNRVPIVGIKKSFVFHRRTKHHRAVRTNWIMHEYYITFSENPQSQNQSSLIRIGKWTLCRVFMKKRMRAIEVGTSDSYSSSASSSDSGVFEEVSSI